MKPINEQLKIQLLEASRKEFLSRGFRDAQVREIAKAAGATTGSIYKYYKDKESLFDALVQEPANHLVEQYRQLQQGFSSLPLGQQVDGLSETASSGLIWMIEYLYEHFDAFKLIACCASGTKYSNYIDTLVQIEVDASLALIEKLNADGRKVRQIDQGMIHIVANAMFSGLFETIIHDMPLEKALEYTKCLRDFYAAGWFQILEL